MKCLKCGKIYKLEDLTHPDRPEDVITCKCGGKAFQPVK